MANEKRDEAREGDEQQVTDLRTYPKSKMKVAEEPDASPSNAPGTITFRRHGSSGGGERTVSVAEWENKWGNIRKFPPGTWDIVKTNVIAAHHSDDY